MVESRQYVFLRIQQCWTCTGSQILAVTSVMIPSPVQLSDEEIRTCLLLVLTSSFGHRARLKLVSMTCYRGSVQRLAEYSTRNW